MRPIILSIWLVCQPWLLVAMSVNQPIHTDCVVLINGKTGRVLWQKNPDELCYPASTTKIATVFYVLMQRPNGLKDRITAQKEALITVSPIEKRKDNYSKCPSYWNETDGTHVGIKLGEEMSVEDLLHATLLASGNDASNVLAQELGGGSIDRFVEDLNGFVQKLGCTKTHFCNPHGMHHPEHVTTARELARIAQCAMYHPLFRKYASTLQYVRAATNKQPKAIYTHSNKLLRQGRYYYPYAVGIKTGYHSKAQNALVAAAEKDGRLLICALMRCKERFQSWQDARTLFDAAFEEKRVEKLLLPEGDQSFAKAVDDGIKPLTTFTKEPIKVSFYPSEEPKYRCLLVWDTLQLPVKSEARVGEVQLLADEEVIVTVPLYAKEDVEEKALSRLIHHIQAYWILYSVAMLIVAWLLIRSFRR